MGGSQARQADRSPAARIDLSGLTIEDARAHLFPAGCPGLTDDAEVVRVADAHVPHDEARAARGPGANQRSQRRALAPPPPAGPR